MVYHHAQPQAKARRSFTTSGLVPCSRTPPFSLRFDIALFRHFLACSFFRHFRHFQPPDHSRSFLIFYSIDHRSSLALPYPIYRRHYSQVFDIVAVAYIAVAAKPWNSAPAPAPVPPTTLVAPSNHGLCSFLLVDGMQAWNAQCNGSRMSNEGIAFCLFCGQLSWSWLHVLMVDAKPGA